MMIRPTELRSIQAGDIDLAFRRWDRPRVVVGTKMRTVVGLVEVTSVEEVAVEALTDEDARRAGVAVAGRPRRGARAEGRQAGVAGRPAARRSRPPRGPAGRGSVARGGDPLVARLERLDRASAYGAWTRETLDLIDRNPERRAPDLAAKVGRETAPFKTDVRKLKELGLTESLAIGYRLSPRGEAVVDRLRGRKRKRAPRPEGTPMPRSIGAPATRALRAADLTSLESLGGVTEEELLAMHGVGPIAIARLREALDDAGLDYRAT